MAKRNWPDHVAVGLEIDVDVGAGATHCKIVDAKSGPLLLSRESLDQKSAAITRTIILRVKAPGIAEFWLPPTDSEKLAKWAEQRRAQQEANDGK